MIRTIILSLISALSFYSSAQTPSPEDDGRKIRIPIAFHVIHKGVEDSVSKESILSELAQLNLDFSGTNDMSMVEPKFKDFIGNPNIEFYLVDDVFHDNIKGIKWLKADADTISKLRTFSPEIDSGNCMNIYIYPRSGAATPKPGNYVNINYTYIGKGTHTLTHEIGHALDLWHLWGHSNCGFFWTLGAKIIFLGRDGVKDTPWQFRCTDKRLKYTDCPVDSKRYKFKKRNYNNFMDYGACRCMFTKGQVIVMRNSIIRLHPSTFEASLE